MSERPFQCVWSSRVHEPLSAAAFAALAERADRHHRLRGVTGCLARDESSYLGLLEGDRETVGALLAGIAGDLRHCAVRVLWEGVGRSRVFRGTPLEGVDLTGATASAHPLAELLDALPRDAHCPGDVRLALASVRPVRVPPVRLVALPLR